jgi:hypothetical protein
MACRAKKGVPLPAAGMGAAAWCWNSWEAPPGAVGRIASYRLVALDTGRSRELWRGRIGCSGGVGPAAGGPHLPLAWMPSGKASGAPVELHSMRASHWQAMIRHDTPFAAYAGLGRGCWCVSSLLCKP